MNLDENIPETVFIIPYRNRLNDKERFIKHMTDYLVGFEGTYKFFFAHQCDERPFNRGAVKNIGFLAIKNLYPTHYKDITFIFHDVDTLPKNKGMIPYKTTHGNVSHYYGVTFALGGIFAIKGGDFEKVKGFPNFWGWGLEDNTIQDRCIKEGVLIDRSIFYKMRDENIYRSNDGVFRKVSKRDSVVYKFETPDNITDLKELKWNIADEMINIYSFKSTMRYEDQDYYDLDIRTSSRIKVPKGYFRRNWGMKYICKK